MGHDRIPRQSGVEGDGEGFVSLVGFKARNHPQQVPKAHVDDRALTLEAFQELHRRFNFTVDAAASAHNAKLAKYFSIDRCGLSASWAGERVYCNPPYSNIAPWVEKAHAEAEVELVVMLLPANRTEQGWWQTGIEPFRRDRGGVLTVEFLPGRIRFLKPGADAIKPNERPPFGCCLVIWGLAA